jgi:hypothetical protein
MSELSFYSIDSFLGWLKGTAFPAAPGTVYLALYNGDPDQNGTEVTTLVNASGRQAITFGSIVHHQITTTALIDFGNAASATTVSWLAVFDAVSGGNCLTRRALEAPVSIASGQDVKVNIADLTIRLIKLDDKLSVSGGATSVPPVLDAFVSGGESADTNTASATITTALANELIVAFVLMNNQDGGPARTVSSISGGGLTWTKRKATTPWSDAQFSFQNNIEIWTAKASSALSSQTITATLSGNSSFANIFLLGIANLNFSNPFDSNASIPAIASFNSGTTSAPNLTLSTDHPNDFIVAMFDTTHTPSGGSTQPGWTSLAQNTSLTFQYKIVSSPQSNLNINRGTNAENGWGAIADAYSGN